MSEHLLRIAREELQSPSLVQLTPQRISSVLTVTSKLLGRLHELSIAEKEAVYGVLRRLSDDVRLLVKARLVKSITTESVSSESMDVAVLRILQALIKAEEVLVSPLTVRYGNRIAYLFTRNCEVGSRVYRKGELALLEPIELALACARECGEPVEEPFYKLYRRKLTK